MVSLQAYRQIVVGKSFGIFPFVIAAANVQGNDFDRLADKSIHEGQFLFCDEIAQDAVAFASHVYGNLFAHRWPPAFRAARSK